MKRKQLSYALLIFLVPVLLIAGCKSGGQRAPSSIDDIEAGEIVNRIETIKQVYHLCPSPAEMLGVIDVSGLSFEEDLVNPVENIDKYIDMRSQTLALGIYITDLAYVALFGRHEETLNYLEIVRNIAEEIRVTGAIDDELIQKARGNIEYLDSLFTISNEAFINMLLFCERNERPNTIIILSAGAFVESLYLAINLVDDYEGAEYILQHIADQKYAIDNLMIFGESLRDTDPNIEATLIDLQALKDIFDGIGIQDGGITIKTPEKEDENQPKKLVIGGESKPQGLSPADFEKLKEETIRLRTRLIEG